MLLKLLNVRRSREPERLSRLGLAEDGLRKLESAPEWFTALNNYGFPEQERERE
jgi:hypothetical protein